VGDESAFLRFLRATAARTKTASPRRDAFRSFAALRKTGVPVGTGGVVCFAEHFLPLAENVYAIPAGLL
jgi:hypothetical protein